MLPIHEIIKLILSAWNSDSKSLKKIISASIVLVIIAIIIATVGLFLEEKNRKLAEQIAGSFAIVAGLVVITLSKVQEAREEKAKETHLQQVEQRVHDNPQETQAAWELARGKLESYVNRNLKHVSAIFWLTVIVMTVGFILIGVGIYLVFEDSKALNASIISSISGILVSFIGATFLVLHKSTMKQAGEYVAILERINAVGMSVQILETIENKEEKLKEKTTADIAKQLLVMYSKNN